MTQLLAAPVLGVLGVVDALVVVLAAVSVLGLLSLEVEAALSPELSLFFVAPPLLL
jgi:hypothetical protein